jgi:hypothetical protein
MDGVGASNAHSRLKIDVVLTTPLLALWLIWSDGDGVLAKNGIRMMTDMSPGLQAKMHSIPPASRG